MFSYFYELDASMTPRFTRVITPMSSLQILAEASSDVAALEEEQKKNEEGASEEAFAKVG